MTFEETVQLLRGAGLIVEVGEGPELVAAADPEDPQPILRQQGVQTVYSFGISLRQINTTWLVRVASPPKPAEQFADLTEAAFRALEVFRRYREHRSPRVFWDQFAAFNASDPCPVVERTLVEAGWLPARPQLDELGLSYPNGGRFLLGFPQSRRIVVVCIDPSADDAWRLVIGCHRIARSYPGPPIPFRNIDRDGRPIPDPVAPDLSYRVARALHAALAKVSSNLRWAVHAEPTEAAGSPVPIAPTPA